MSKIICCRVNLHIIFYLYYLLYFNFLLSFKFLFMYNVLYACLLTIIMKNVCHYFVSVLSVIVSENITAFDMHD